MRSNGEEIAANGGTATTIKYYSVPGVCTVVNIGGTLSYLAQDGLGSVTEALSASGSVTASQLYSPYGGVRYTSGVMPTAKGYTGQYADAASSGLDYYHARYYDPALGQFASADSDAKGGLNRYGYVAGNPETATDPTGHRCTVDTCGGGGGGGSGGCTKNCDGSGGSGDDSNANPHKQDCHADNSCKSKVQCDDACKAKANKQAWIEYYEKEKGGILVGFDKVRIGVDLAFLIADVGLAIAGVGASILSAITDIFALGADIAQFVKDDSLADGNAAHAQGASNWGSVLNAMSLIGNIMNVAAQVFSIFGGFGGLKDAAKPALEKLAGAIVGAIGSASQATGAAYNLTLDQVDSQELAVEQMSTSQLDQLGMPPATP